MWMRVALMLRGLAKVNVAFLGPSLGHTCAGSKR
jgi:hypothetical protein